MQKKKNKIENPLYAIVLIVLILVAVNACKKKSPEYPHLLTEKYYTYYKNFYIEGINMSRIHIEGESYDKYALYLIEVRIVGCNKEERIHHDNDWEGGIEYPFCYGAIEPIKNIIFKTSKNKIISPNPLNLTHKFIIIKNKDKKGYKGICYEKEFKCLPSDMSNPARSVSGFHEQLFLRPGSREKDTLNYLITFYKDHQLPDSIIINCSTSIVKSKINNKNDNSVYITKDL